jgi:hypothetical protein
MKYLIFFLITTTTQAQQLSTGAIQIVKDKKLVNITIDSLNPLNNVFVPITASSLPLPSGAATEAKQDTGNTSLSSINGKLGSLGQKTMSGSAPVVIASDQSAIPITGTISATNPSVGSNNTAIPTSSTLVGASDGVDLRPIKSDSSGELQIDVLSSALPTGAATSSNQTNGSQKGQVVDGSGDIADVVLLSTGLQGTDKGLVTNTIIHGETTGGGGGYVDVKVTPSGAMVTESTIASIADVDGQKPMATSLPVVIASDQSAIAITAASLPLPSGAATETTLTSIDTKTPALVSGRVPVDGSGVTQPVSASALPLPSGASTEAKQDTGNTSLANIDGKIPSNLTVSSTRLLVDGSGVTQPVSISASVQTKAPVNTGGSFFTASISSVATVTAPANATEVIIQASDTNTANMRFVIGGTASSSNGIELQPGRSETLKVGANVSIAPVSGTQKYNIQYIVQ